MSSSCARIQSGAASMPPETLSHSTTTVPLNRAGSDRAVHDGARRVRRGRARRDTPLPVRRQRRSGRVRRGVAREEELRLLVARRTRAGTTSPRSSARPAPDRSRSGSPGPAAPAGAPSAAVTPTSARHSVTTSGRKRCIRPSDGRARRRGIPTDSSRPAGSCTSSRTPPPARRTACRLRWRAPKRARSPRVDTLRRNQPDERGPARTRPRTCT